MNCFAMYGNCRKGIIQKKLKTAVRWNSIFFFCPIMHALLSRCKGEVIQTDSIIALFWNYELWRRKKVLLFLKHIFWSLNHPPSLVWKEISQIRYSWPNMWKHSGLNTQFVFPIWFDKIYFVVTVIFSLKVFFTDYSFPWQKKVCENVVTF